MWPMTFFKTEPALTDHECMYWAGGRAALGRGSRGVCDEEYSRERERAAGVRRADSGRIFLISCRSSPGQFFRKVAGLAALLAPRRHTSLHKNSSWKCPRGGLGDFDGLVLRPRAREVAKNSETVPKHPTGRRIMFSGVSEDVHLTGPSSRFCSASRAEGQKVVAGAQNQKYIPTGASYKGHARACRFSVWFRAPAKGYAISARCTPLEPAQSQSSSLERS